MTRHSSSAVIAALVTFGLFYTMHALSQLGDVKPPDSRRHGWVIGWELPPELDRTRPTVTRPPRVDPTPRTPSTIQLASFGTPPTEPLQPGRPDPIVLWGPDREPPPITEECMLMTTGALPYPARHLDRAGWVHLEFDVTAAGTTANIQVLDSEPPGIFEGAARSGARHFRYRPAMEAGQPVPCDRVQFVVRFDPTQREE